MRNTYKMILKEYLQNKIVSERKNSALVQEAMADKLEMSWRSYANIENGKNMCSTLTFIIYLLNFKPSTEEMLAEIRELFEKATEEEDG